MPRCSLMSMGTPFLFQNQSSHTINIQRTKFGQNSIVSFLYEEFIPSIHFSYQNVAVQGQLTRMGINGCKLSSFIKQFVCTFSFWGSRHILPFHRILNLYPLLQSIVKCTTSLQWVQNTCTCMWKNPHVLSVHSTFDGLTTLKTTLVPISLAKVLQFFKTLLQLLLPVNYEQNY